MVDIVFSHWPHWDFVFAHELLKGPVFHRGFDFAHGCVSGLLESNFSLLPLDSVSGSFLHHLKLLSVLTALKMSSSQEKKQKFLVPLNTLKKQNSISSPLVTILILQPLPPKRHDFPSSEVLCNVFECTGL